MNSRNLEWYSGGTEKLIISEVFREFVCVNAGRPPRGVNGKVSYATTFNNKLHMPEFSIVAITLMQLCAAG